MPPAYCPPVEPFILDGTQKDWQLLFLNYYMYIHSQASTRKPCFVTRIATGALSADGLVSVRRAMVACSHTNKVHA